MYATMNEFRGKLSLAVQNKGLSPCLEEAIRHSTSAMALEEAAGFGRWWFDPTASQIVLSEVAAQYLHVEGGCHERLDDCFLNVVADDLSPLIAQFSQDMPQTEALDFRVIGAHDGMHWLRLKRLPAGWMHSTVQRGILVDITPIKHASMRERLGFELTEFLGGSHPLGDAITNVIQLICKNLGWDWGAYWAMEPTPQGAPRLGCKYFWHQPELDLAAFGRESTTMQLAPGEGLVGSVWSSGQADWVEDMVNDQRFARRTQDRDCRLWSGYVFPVTYVSADGQQHSPGVLEFYSCLSRQQEAQLPKLSATIGALIAQMARRLEQQATMQYLAQVDELTGLSNRSHFHELLNQACEVSAQAQTTFNLAFIDLDRFKPINDAFGHEAGNRVLREFAQRLRALAPEGASVGRLGGDEFAMLFTSASAEESAALVERVLLAARTPFAYEGVELTVSASVGVSTFPHCGRTCPELLHSADAAMYRIKNNGRNGCHFLSITSTNALVEHQSFIASRLALETDLHHALQSKELFLVYQPIVNTVNRRLHGLEALLRWRRADGSLVPPDVFIPIAEQSHLIVDIGKWVVAQACRDLATLRAAQFRDLSVHVNMAASEFANTTLPAELLHQVTSLGLAPHNLTLELTEGMLMTRPDQVIPVMRAIRQLGFGISLDDFGMGHSSLALLKNLPISSLKIDRSFVRDLAQQRNDRAIVKTILDLGRHMGLEVIAEGIETATQLEVLQQSGCRLIQGFLLERPMPLDDLLAKFAPGGQTCPVSIPVSSAL
jgi:diguanylate cyclase (GGDEF)-like protein